MRLELLVEQLLLLVCYILFCWLLLFFLRMEKRLFCFLLMRPFLRCRIILLLDLAGFQFRKNFDLFPYNRVARLRFGAARCMRYVTMRVWRVARR